MKFQSSLIVVTLILTSFVASIPADAKGSSGGSSRSTSSSSSRPSFGSSSSRTSPSSFRSSKTSTSSSSGSKSTSASAFNRGPSTATKAVATQKATSLNNSAKPLTPTQLASSGVKTAKPSELGMSTSDTNRLTAMQTQYNAYQSIPDSQRNVSNPVYVRNMDSYNRDRVIILNQYPTTYIPPYGYGAPYSGGYVQHLQPADDASGVENFFKGFLTFLLWMSVIGLGGFGVYQLISFAIERNEEIKAEKARIEEAKKRF
jgi:hypothetical protein